MSLVMDPINAPAHYASNGAFESIDVIELCGAGPGFCFGNAMKYILRAGKKGGPGDAIKDLNKAGWYVTRYHQLVSVDGFHPVEAVMRQIDLEDFDLVPTLRIAADLLRAHAARPTDPGTTDALMQVQTCLVEEILSYMAGHVSFPLIEAGTAQEARTAAGRTGNAR